MMRSADITNLAGIVMSYDRDKELLQTQRRLVVSKSRLLGKLCLDGYVLDYDDRSKRIYGMGDELNREFGWQGEVDFEAVDEETPFDGEIISFE